MTAQIQNRLNCGLEAIVLDRPDNGLVELFGVHVRHVFTAIEYRNPSALRLYPDHGLVGRIHQIGLVSRVIRKRSDPDGGADRDEP